MLYGNCFEHNFVYTLRWRFFRKLRLAANSTRVSSRGSRHFVSNIRVRELDGGQVGVKSNLLIYRTRGDQTQPQLLSGERQDVLRVDYPVHWWK